LARKDHIKDAAEARCDLFAFDAVVALLDGSCGPSSRCEKAVAKIIAIAKDEMRRCLERMDAAITSASK
jgi:hypothetical protein